MKYYFGNMDFGTFTIGRDTSRIAIVHELHETRHFDSDDEAEEYFETTDYVSWCRAEDPDELEVTFSASCISGGYLA